jgi:signal transduction histidine kinase
VRRRLALAIVAVTAGAIVLFAVPLAIALRQVYRDEDLLRLERDTVAATRGIDIGAGADPVEIPRRGDRRAVYDRAGHVLAGRPSRTDSHVARDALRSGRPTVRSVSGGMVAAVPILTNERVTGVLVAGRSDSASAQDTRQAWALLGGLAAAVMLAAIAAALLVARGLARPLERVADSARRLGHGDFSVRAPRAHVAEVDQVAEALDATAARLGEMVSRERSFSADASHQLRTPLTALRIELEEAELRGDGAEPSAALRQVDRLEQTIETLLTVARGTGQSNAQVELTALAEDLEADWRPRLAALGRPLRLRLERPPVVALAHEGVVREIVGVLLDNALRHGSGAVDMSIRSRPGWAQVEIRDEGRGFGPDPERAFERGSSRDGHGIGLALARALAHAEGGRLSVASPGPSPVLSLVLRGPPAE